jgi:hypothetical protein
LTRCSSPPRQSNPPRAHHHHTSAELHCGRCESTPDLCGSQRSGFGPIHIYEIAVNQDLAAFGALTGPRCNMKFMFVTCPTCGTSFDLADRERPGGLTGGSYCPHCHEQFSLPGPSVPVAIGSLLLSLGALAAIGVRSVLGLVVGSMLLWVPISLFWNASEMGRKGVVLRKWKPLMRRTFSDWLYERNKPPELFDKEKRSG